MELDQETALRIFERMLLMRRFEECVVQLFTDGAYVGHCHVYIGQEATAGALVEQLGDGDLVLATHRNHGHFIARGGDPDRALAEILGRADGVNGGRGGSAHLCDVSIGFPWSTAIVGGSIGLGIGAAYALKQSGGGGVAVAFFGDGALEEGIAFESLNIAALQALPILFVCENNSGGALGVAAGEWPSSTLRARQLVDIPAALGIRAEAVDGADAAAVHALAADAIADLRQGRGPVFIEARTERWPGTRFAHTQLATGVTEIAAAWRPELIAGEHADWIGQHDPLLRLARALLDAGYSDGKALLALDAAARSRIEAARDFALASPLPDPATAFAGAFTQSGAGR